MRARILSGLASMPFVETKQPRTFPFVIPNIHFSGLSFSLASRIFLKVPPDRRCRFPSFFWP
jgi:hypothetical protein